MTSNDNYKDSKMKVVTKTEDNINSTKKEKV